MINGNSYDALTIHGIEQLFSQNFEGQRYKLQIVHYVPSVEQPFIIFLSDGYAWIKGELVGEAKNFALKNSQLKNYSVIEFLSNDIEINETQMFFRLKRIVEFDSKVHNKIGQPIRYEDYKKRGCINQTGTNNIMSGVKTYTIREAKQLKIGTIKGHIIAKVIRKPDKISSFLNIMIEDEEKQQIQCCFFGKNVDKYHPMLHVGAWYRFEDAILQTNNRQGGTLELKINEFSNVVKHKAQNQTQQIGFLRANTIPQNNQRFKPENIPQTEFILSNFQRVSEVNQQINYFIVAKVVKINVMKDGASRSLNCKDKTGSWIQITIWKEFQSIPLRVDETYKFRFLKAKIYKGMVSLQSRKNVTKVEICQQSILPPQQNLSFRSVTSTRQFRKPEKFYQNIKSLKQTFLMMQSSKQKVCYGIVFGTMIYPFQFTMATIDMFAEMRKKLFYLNCQYCDKNDYRKAKIQPQIKDQGIVCSVCKSPSLILYWNLKVNIVDSELELSCKVNNEIAQKLLGMTAREAMIQFIKSPERVRKEVHNKLNLFSGVFKISSKLNEKREGQRFYNICQYYPDSKKAESTRIKQDFYQALQTFNKYCSPDEKITKQTFVVPSFLLGKKDKEQCFNKKGKSQSIDQQDENN